MTRIFGADLALNHSGFVLLDNAGKMIEWTFASDTKKHVKDVGLFMPYAKKPGMDREQNQARRLHWWGKYLPTLLDSWKPTHAAIEDYALSAQGQVYHIGEVGGLLRLAVLRRKIPMRLHDPLTVKLFAAHHGGAHPETVMMEVFERWPETVKAWGELELIPQMDLTVAFVLAKMAHVEIQLRAGKLKMDTLHEKEIAVFNRTTKANPTNLLSREWITLV